jgi:nucleoside-diphosphate-sugar epimerase
MRIIVTGSTGFIGRNLIPALLKENNQVLELTRSEEKSESLFGESTVKFQITDEQDALKIVVEQFNPEIVIHLAAMLTSSDEYESMHRLIDSNIVFLCRILDALKGTKLELFINTGTFAEYFNGDMVNEPAYLYAATKTASRSFVDYYSKAYKFKQVTVIPYTVYGGKESQKKIIDIIIDSIFSDIPIDLTPGDQILDFIHIDDVIKLFLRVIEKEDFLPSKSNIFAGTGKGTSLKQLAKIIEDKTGKKTNINWGGKPYRPTDVMYAVADISRQFHLLKWKPLIDIKEGISHFINSK